MPRTPNNERGWPGLFDLGGSMSQSGNPLPCVHRHPFGYFGYVGEGSIIWSQGILGTKQ